MTARLNPPIGGTPLDVVNYSIQEAQQDVNTAKKRDKDLELADGRMLSIFGPSAIRSEDSLEITEHVFDIPLEVGAPRASIIRLNANGPYRVYGIQARANAHLRIINVSSSNMTIHHQEAAVPAENRIIFPLALNYSLGVNYTLELWYDPVTERWRALQ